MNKAYCIKLKYIYIIFLSYIGTFARCRYLNCFTNNYVARSRFLKCKINNKTNNVSKILNESLLNNES